MSHSQKADPASSATLRPSRNGPPSHCITGADTKDVHSKRG